MLPHNITMSMSIHYTLNKYFIALCVKSSLKLYTCITKHINKTTKLYTCDICNSYIVIGILFDHWKRVKRIIDMHIDDTKYIFKKMKYYT
jgi:hypothetical protein